MLDNVLQIAYDACMKKPAPKPTRETTISLRVPIELKERVSDVASAERRTISQWVEGLILDALAKVKRKAK